MEGILGRFCTPPQAEDGDDAKALEGAKESTVACGERNLACYEWGGGTSVLLAHGWGSRAGHMALIARSLARRGFRVVAFDGPAHGRTRGRGGPAQSSMFEFCECLAAVARAAGPFHAVVGHSIGAAAAVFTAAGYARLALHTVRADRLVLISMPSGVERMMRSFCARDGGAFEELRPALERKFCFKVDDYVVSAALPAVKAAILAIHDEDDEEVPVAEARALAESNPTMKLVLTRGSGHGKVLVNREAIRAVVGFLSEP